MSTDLGTRQSSLDSRQDRLFIKNFLVQCPPIGTFDLALLLDTHSDMGTPNLEATRQFAQSIVEKFDIGSDTTKVTVAGYSGEKVTPSTRDLT